MTFCVDADLTNFYQFDEKIVKFCTQSVEIYDTQCGNYRNLLSHFFGKNFVKPTFLLKKLLKSWFDEIFFGESKFFILPHCVLKSHLGKYSVKTIYIAINSVDFTNFLKEIVAECRKIDNQV